MAGKSYEKESKKLRKIELDKINKDLKDAPKRTDAEEGALLRNTTVEESKKRTSELNKKGKKGFKPAANLSDYSSQLKALLSNKDNLVGIDSGDGRNKYQVQINKLKKRMKAEGLKFSSLLRDVKKQEKAGTFDRGAEGKSKNKLRAKMQSEKIGKGR